MPLKPLDVELGCHNSHSKWKTNQNQLSISTKSKADQYFCQFFTAGLTSCQLVVNRSFVSAVCVSQEESRFVDFLVGLCPQVSCLDVNAEAEKLIH